VNETLKKTKRKTQGKKANRQVDEMFETSEGDTDTEEENEE
jgi:hypothetical protein